MSEKEEEKGGEGEAKPAAKSKKKLFIIIGAVLAVVVLGGVGAMMMGGKKEAPKGAEPQHEEVRKQYATAELASIIVNLSDSSSYLKVTMLIEYDEGVIHRFEAAESSDKGGGGGGGHAGGGGGGKAGGLPAPMAKREPMIKDAIIRVLSSKKVDELLSPEGKDKLKDELIDAINEASGLEESPVVSIYFTEFIIQ